jgi:hypothetical protein
MKTKTALNRRRLRNPARMATSVIGKSVQSSKRFALNARRFRYLNRGRIQKTRE